MKPIKEIKPVRIEFWRIGAQAGTSGEPAMEAHRERAELLHAAQSALGVEVIDWGDTDVEQSREIVEVVIALTPVVVPALASLIKLWLDSRRLEKVVVVRPNGTKVEIGSGTPEQIASLLGSVGE